MSLQSLLDSLSKKPGSLFLVTLPNGIDVSFRLPSVKEALQYKLLLDNALDTFHTYIIHEHIFNTYTEDSILKENDDLHAGVVETISGLILYLSGIDNRYEEYTEELLKHYRNSANTLYNFFRRSICSVFPGYKFSDLDSLDYQDLIHLYTQAEPLLLQQGIIEKELTIKQEVVKPVSITEMISRDVKDYDKWNRDEAPPPNIKDIQEEHRTNEIKERQKKQKEALEKIKKQKARRG